MMQNRELSWIRFNERVLEEADDNTVPLLEQFKFLSIFTSNLDEFYMIRVGILQRLATEKKHWKDNKCGMTAKEQLNAIYSETTRLYKHKDKTYEILKEKLLKEGIEFISYKKCNKQEQKSLRNYFEESILPLLSPQIVDARHPTPNLQTKISYVFVSLKSPEGKTIGIIPCPATIPEIIPIPGSRSRFIFTEILVSEFAETIFSMYKVISKNFISVTRNCDLTTDEEMDGSEDYRNQMKNILKKRRASSVVRVEIAGRLTSEILKFVSHKLNVDSKTIFKTSVPLRMKFPLILSDLIPHELASKLSFTSFYPTVSKNIDATKSMLQQISNKDLMLHYPYESMDPFLKLIKEAADDPNTISIKITIYRLAHKAKLVDYLCHAAENGIEVTVLIELRARFDELNNIDWSEYLEDAGCCVLYGPVGYKVHSKICLITRRVGGKIQHITQIGTGNYNEKTSKIYTDLSFMTSDTQIGKDAVELFKNISIGSLTGKYNKLLISPTNLKSQILQLIDAEIQHQNEGRIIFKMNSLTDIDIIQKLLEASKAGVKITLIIRGICCLRPGIPGETENIIVRSIVGRFLEHSRIYLFGTGLRERYFIGSADMMTRNTECRIEVLTPIKSKEIRLQLKHILDTLMADNSKARIMQPSGKYAKVISKKHNSRDDTPARICAQEIFMEEVKQIELVDH